MKQVLLAILATIVAACFCIHAEYIMRAGPSSDPPQSLVDFEPPPPFIADASTNGSAKESTVILFYHPHCPCTKATVNNFKTISENIEARVHLLALAYRPKDSNETWIETEITKQLRELGFEIATDTDGTFCRQFDVYTSGHILVYESNERLVFNGGITTSRGHEGSNYALADFLKSIDGSRDANSVWPVFGCPIIPVESST